MQAIMRFVGLVLVSVLAVSTVFIAQAAPPAPQVTQPSLYLPLINKGYAILNDAVGTIAPAAQADLFNWLKEANSQVLQQSLKNLDAAFSNYFEMRKNGTLPPAGKKPRKDGMPKGYQTYHSKHDDQSIRNASQSMVSWSTCLRSAGYRR